MLAGMTQPPDLRAGDQDRDRTISRLREAAKAAANDPAFLAALARVQTPPQYLDQPQFRAFWDADAKKLEGVVQRIGKVE
jgi:tripartite-type tricarboxylate transporter receptor subunit TctC